MMKSLSVLILCFLLLFTACGNNSGAPEQTNQPDELTAAVDASSQPTETTPAGTPEPLPEKPAPAVTTGGIWDDPSEKVLNISQCWDFYYLEETAEKFKALHPEVTINVTKYDNDYEKYTTQTAAALMAGTADDLLDGFGLDYRNSSTVKLLADFYPIMQADPAFNENEYYMNVFEALAFEGGLYTYPACFSYSLEVVNNRVSEELTARYAALQTVTSFDILDLYNNAPGTQGYFINDGWDVSTALGMVSDSFINLEKKTCDFNNQRFIDFITGAKKTTEPSKMFGYTYSSNVYDPDTELTNSQKYLFQSVSPSVYQYILPFENQLCYSELRPVTNEKGQMLMSPLKNFCISAQSKNKELAWEFIKFINSMEANDFEQGYVFIPDIPVYKPLFTYKMKTELPGWIEYYETNFEWRVTGDVESVVADVIARMDTLNSMPLLMQSSVNAYDILEQFNNGTLSAEQTAAEIQNKISLQLME